MPEGIQDRGVQSRIGTQETQIDSNVIVTWRAFVNGVLRAAFGPKRGEEEENGENIVMVFVFAFLQPSSCV